MTTAQTISWYCGTNKQKSVLQVLREQTASQTQRLHAVIAHNFKANNILRPLQFLWPCGG